VLVSSAHGLVSPTTLVVDFSSQKLYWLDSAAEKIGHVNFDGSQPFTQTISGLSQVSAMTVYRVRTEMLEVNFVTNSNCFKSCNQYDIIPCRPYLYAWNQLRQWPKLIINGIFSENLTGQHSLLCRALY